MSGAQDDDTEKPFEASPQKLLRAREKGDIAKSADLSVAAGYAGLLICLAGLGAYLPTRAGSLLMVLVDQADSLSELIFTGAPHAPFGGLLLQTVGAFFPMFALPALAVLLSLLAQRAIVFAPSKLKPKASRLSILSNAKHKFGRSGLFEFTKSFAKLIIYSCALGVFLRARLTEIVTASQVEPQVSVALLGRLGVEFLTVVLLIAGAIGMIDALWQHAEHKRKNRMSLKEMRDEHKDSEGDPHLKQARRLRGQEIANSQMMADVPGADVVIVNPTHFAVALKWSRLPGEAPVCVAKGVDEVAATIRRTAMEAGVPIHSDPPIARALHATVDLGQEIGHEHYRAVAAAIRFAEDMRKRAKARP